MADRFLIVYDASVYPQTTQKVPHNTPYLIDLTNERTTMVDAKLVALTITIAIVVAVALNYTSTRTTRADAASPRYCPPRREEVHHKIRVECLREDVNCIPSSIRLSMPCARKSARALSSLSISSSSLARVHTNSYN